ncbi:LysR family transcriptional regulator [Bradyrhizobium diversitatis]|uniref:LysR family transcriptional regulator n=1 Tax=Bradyrhizobium diversitatis TaxID=2755406 RepID=A0ABS0PBV5_9BRAD|nr:LysR family transcriptional regulator [Bradyrhizobium diversitatis]MBH5390668.1 LysR family transcriptional regulator [Bradyrhizobium diversitatis]
MSKEDFREPPNNAASLCQPSAIIYHYRTELFTRESRGMLPTAAGERLHVHAKSILKAVATAEDDLRHARTEPPGEVSVVMAQSAIKAVGIDFFYRVVGEFPKLRISITESLSGSTLSVLMSNNVDIDVQSTKRSQPKIHTASGRGNGSRRDDSHHRQHR